MIKLKKLFIVSTKTVLATLGIGFHSAAFGANSLIQSNNGIGGGTAEGVGFINIAPMGRACGMIQGIVTLEDPVGACDPVNGPVPPNRSIGPFTDAQGNRIEARSRELFALGRFKGFAVSAQTNSVTRNTFAEAEYVDPLVFFHPDGASFEVELVRSFLSMDSTDPGLQIVGSAGLGESASSSLHLEMSTDLTGFLFALDLTFKIDKPLNVDLTIGSYLEDFLEWDETTLENELKSLLDAGNPDNNFTLSDFDFPNILINVPAGQSLSVFTSDVLTAQASVPEPTSTLSLFVFGTLGAGSAFLRKKKIF